MYRHQGLTNLIGRIYDTTLDPSLWPDVLDRTARFVGGSAAVLINKNPTAKSVSLFHESGADWNYLNLYYNRYIELDPITTRRYMRMIVPHIRRSMMIGRAVDIDRTESRTFKETLDSLGAGFFLVDACGRIVHANSAGNDLLDAADFLRCSDGRLVASDGE